MELVCGSIGKATSVDGGTVSVDASNARGGSSIVSIGNRPLVVSGVRVSGWAGVCLVFSFCRCVGGVEALRWGPYG